jgi:hypothetical protein
MAGQPGKTGTKILASLVPLLNLSGEKNSRYQARFGGRKFSHS